MVVFLLFLDFRRLSRPSNLLIAIGLIFNFLRMEHSITVERIDKARGIDGEGLLSDQGWEEICFDIAAFVWPHIPL